MHTAIEEEGGLKRSNHDEEDDGVPDGLWQSVEAHPVEPDVDDGAASVEKVVFFVKDEGLRFSGTAVSCLRAHHDFALVL